MSAATTTARNTSEALNMRKSTSADTRDTGFTQPNAPLILETRDLSIFYGKTEAVKKASLLIAEKHITPLSGPRVAGKAPCCVR